MRTESKISNENNSHNPKFNNRWCCAAQPVRRLALNICSRTNSSTVWQIKLLSDSATWRLLTLTDRNLVKHGKKRPTQGNKPASMESALNKFEISELEFECLRTWGSDSARRSTTLRLSCEWTSWLRQILNPERRDPLAALDYADDAG